MSALSPIHAPPHRSPMLGGVLLATLDTLYFWFSGGRPLSADLEAVRRIVIRLRAAATR